MLSCKTHMPPLSTPLLCSSPLIRIFFSRFASRSSQLLALNKSGHGLHVCDPLFKSYSTSPKIKSLVNSIGWTDPRIPQSMYIFKQPRIGGEVTSHQDSTFLHTEDTTTSDPAQSCLGLWLALHPATVENGCLWVRPGSHREVRGGRGGGGEATSWQGNS